MKYTIFHTQPHHRYITIEATLENVKQDIIEIQLPSWRPGRYELGNFAKNVRKFTVLDSKGSELPFFKVTKDLWQVQTLGNSVITISYQYFAAVLDAGSTYTDESMLYVNPVNCLVYETTSLDEPCELRLDIPDNFIIACALPLEGKILKAQNFDELADSPLMASPSLEHYSTVVEGVTQHVWISGKHTLDANRFVQEVAAYTREQVAVFNHFPSNGYHYLIHLMPNSFRHGVEHCHSTVIAMGHGIEFHTPEKHRDLLAICSHELFHFWNIKRLRPAVMLPYDYTKENYSTLGYVYEGITTYYGDYMLLRSGVNSFETYAGEFSKDLQRHFDNTGRYNYSVADSSFDTWLDGYVPGTPGRKVSIYVEGMLSALIADVAIREATDNKANMDTVLKLMYDRCFMNGAGYTEEDYRAAIEEVSGLDMETYFRDIIWGKGNIEKQLPQTLDKLGLTLVVNPIADVLERLYGIKAVRSAGHLVVSAVAENSPADEAGVALGAFITSINGVDYVVDIHFDEVFALNTNGITIGLHTVYADKIIQLSAGTTTYFDEYHLVKQANATQAQKDFFKAWSKQEF